MGALKRYLIKQVPPEMARGLTYHARSIANDRPVEIYINDNEEPDFTIPKSILDNLSDALAKSLAPADRKDPQESPIELRLPDDDDDACNIFIDWAYKHRLLPADEISECVKSHGDAWVAAWLLAERNGLPELQDLIMLELLNLRGDIEADALAHICEFLKPDTELSRFFAEEAISIIVNEGFDEDGLEGQRGGHGRRWDRGAHHR